MDHITIPINKKRLASVFRAVMMTAAGFIPFTLGAVLLNFAVETVGGWEAMIASYAFFLTCAAFIYAGLAKDESNV